MKTLHLLLLCSALPVVLAHGAAAAGEVRVAHDAGGALYSDRLGPSAGASLALASERAALTPGRLGGTWLAHGDDGSLTLLELRPGGAFTFDHQVQATPERDYMCGDWTLEAGAELALRATTRKTRLATGEIELVESATLHRWTVLAARSDMLILRGDAGTLTFRRGA
jgi:hypothetical protein